LNAGEEYGNQVLDKHHGALWQKYFAQEKLQNLFGFVSPFASVRAFSMGMAGTDLAQQKHFTDSVELYRRDFNRFLNLDFAMNSATKDDYNYFVNREVWEKSPEFIYAAPDAAWVWQKQIWNLVALFLWCFGALGAAVFVANRMKAF